MKTFFKRLTALALGIGMFVTPASAITLEGENETWFDGVWALIDAFGLKVEHNPYVLQNYINKYLEEHPEELYNVLSDILSLLDTHSMYMSSEEYAAGFSTLEGFVGVGVQIQQDDSGVVIAGVIPDSAAEEAGLQEGDRIMAIDGEDMAEKTVSEVAELLRGKEGTTVQIRVLRQGREIDFTCTRRHVTEVYVTNKTVADGVEYIKISAFGSEKDWQTFSEIMEGLPAKDTRAVILDLRGNGGGLIDAAFNMMNLLVPVENRYMAGIHYRDDSGGLERHMSTGVGLPLNKLIILVDGDTASAAELMSGSLQDMGIATLLGEQTYGKGQGQYHIPLVNGDKLVITSFEMELPQTGVFEGVGLTPNITLSNKKITVNAETLKTLDTSKPLYFGDTSDAVYAMTERLSLFGLIDVPTRNFDADTLQAVQSFQDSHELEIAQYASVEMLEELEKSIQALDGMTYELDTQLKTAIDICKLAAQSPAKYTVQADGTWTKN